MNAIASFRLNTLTDDELLRLVDKKTDEIFKTQKVPTVHIPAENPRKPLEECLIEAIKKANELYNDLR